MQALPDGLLDEVEQLAAGPAGGEVDGEVALGELVAAGGGHGGGGDEPLGEVHAAVHVGEGHVGLHRRELGGVAGVDALVAEVAAELEHLLVAADDEALQVELGRDAQRQVDVEGVGVGLEGAGDGAAGLGLEDGRLDLDEALGLELLAQGGDDGDAGVEDLLGGGVGDEVELAVAGPDVGVGDGLVGAEGVQRLGEDPQLGDLDAELAPAGGDDLALGPDPVADVEGLEHGGGLGDELVVLEEELHVAALVVEGGEAEEALGPDRAPGGRRRGRSRRCGCRGPGRGGRRGAGRRWPCGRTSRGGRRCRRR